MEFPLGAPEFLSTDVCPGPRLSLNVPAVYNSAQRLPERRTMMERWATTSNSCAKVAQSRNHLPIRARVDVDTGRLVKLSAFHIKHT
jgi:hypothetical protein